MKVASLPQVIKKVVYSALFAEKPKEIAVCFCYDGNDRHHPTSDHSSPRGFVAIGFKFDTMMDVEDPLQFAKKIGVRHPLAVATDRIKQKFGGVEGLPTTMLYDGEGILRTKTIGFEYTDNIESVLKPLL